MPAGPPEMLLPTTLASLLARSGPKMEMPTSPERLMSLETILVPVESKITVPTEVLSVMSLLERILVPVDLTTSMPRLLSVRSLPATVALVPSSIKIPLLELPSTSFPEIVTSRDLSRPIASSPESRTTLERNLVLIERKVPMPFLLPTARIFVTVASRAAATSIPTALKPRIVKPETLTSLTRLLTSPVSGLKSPRTQIAVGPENLEQGESALAGGLITASSPRSLIPSLRITTSSRWTPRTTMVSPGSAALIAFWMDSPGPTTELCAPAEPIPTASATPLATKRVRIMVATSSMVRLIKRPPLCRGAKEERCQSPAPLRNEGSILHYEQRVCAPAQYVLQSTKVASELLRIPLPRTPVNKDRKKGRSVRPRL